MRFGLKESDITSLNNFAEAIPEITELLVFGSRALGNYKKGSDVDIAIKGDVNSSSLSKINTLVEDSTLPYFFDFVNYADIENLDLKKHIDTHGKILYKKI